MFIFHSVQGTFTCFCGTKFTVKWKPARKYPVIKCPLCEREYVIKSDVDVLTEEE